MLSGYIGEFTGLKLIETTVITKKVQVRKHKKKRINKKWAKRYGFKEVPDNERAIVANGCLFAQPQLMEKITMWVDNYNRGI